MEIEDLNKISHKDMYTVVGDNATIPDQLPQSLINLRDYQQELAVLALKGSNTIICAGTNSGKTFVALHVIERHLANNTAGKSIINVILPTNLILNIHGLHEVAINQSYSYKCIGGKINIDIYYLLNVGKVVFMTRTNVLLGQQFETACKLLPNLSAKGKIRKWEADQDITSETFKNMVNRCSIIFLTPKSLCNFLDNEIEHSRVDIDQFTLLVLDECHHTYGKSPYNEIMGHYRKKKFGNGQNKLPQIMGLTASPGTNRAKDKFGAKEHLLRIMTNLDVKELSVVTKCESNLLEYSSRPDRVPIISKQRQENPVQDILMKAMDSVEDILDCSQITTYLMNPTNDAEGLFEALRNPPKDRTSERYILWLSETKKKIEEKSTNEIQVLRLMHACFRHLEFYAECLEVNSLLDISHVRSKLKDGLKRLKEESIKASDDKEIELIDILNEVFTKVYALGRRIEGNPDVEKIIEVLKKEYQKQEEDSRFLIFVKTRTTAKSLVEKLPVELNSRHLTGSQVSKEEGGLSKEEQIDIVKRFKEGKHLCLVATSVASEGLDIQQCTLMIRYRLQANEISSYQMRGRIRREGGKEVLIASQEELEREEINVERLFLMELAIKEVLKEDVKQEIATSERNIYEMEEQTRQRLKTNHNSEKKGKFYINCAKCGKFIVDGQYIRRIKKAHCIICDKEIFDKIDRRQTKKSQTFAEIKKTDKVFGLTCGHNWGSILIYQECAFVSLSQDYMTIVDKETREPLCFRKWSDVHMEYPLDDITDTELIEYRSKQ
ncbi:interferon-induced helicase C domain-containing protein 1-like [Mytilus galloprovincialis]|uniref:interferon-induced helicase C domain-containing protein 1-like n=1 Tax=Mytilus galloprovincialis TaxID=29158 RepID=UPI003F7BED23